MDRLETINRRSQETPLLDLDRTIWGIRQAFAAIPIVGESLSVLAQNLLVTEIPGVTLTRAQRELIATYVSARNGCVFCTKSHGAVVEKQFQKVNTPFDVSQFDVALETGAIELVEGIDDRMQALLKIAGNIQIGGMANNERDVQAAKDLGVAELDIHLTIDIASAFCMYNRIVDGERVITSANASDYQATAERLSTFGYIPPSPR